MKQCVADSSKNIISYVPATQNLMAKLQNFVDCIVCPFSTRELLRLLKWFIDFIVWVLEHE